MPESGCAKLSFLFFRGLCVCPQAKTGQVIHSAMLYEACTCIPDSRFNILRRIPALKFFLRYIPLFELDDVANSQHHKHVFGMSENSEKGNHETITILWVVS